MKKISMFLFTAVLFISFAACSGGSKKSEETATKKETTTPKETYSQPTSADALKAFAEYAKEYSEAFGEKEKDLAKYQKLASQSQQKVADMERLKIDFNAEQLQEYEKALEIVNKVNSEGQ